MKKFNLSRMCWNDLTDEETQVVKDWLDSEFSHCEDEVRYHIAYNMVMTGFDLDDYLKNEIECIIDELDEVLDIDYSDETYIRINNMVAPHFIKLVDGLHLKNDEFRNIIFDSITEYLNRMGIE